MQCGLEYLAKEADGAKEVEEATRESLMKALERSRIQLANLNQMRLKDLLNDEEYVAEKQPLLGERVRLERALQDVSLRHQSATESAAELLTFGHKAASAFQMGTLDENGRS